MPDTPLPSPLGFVNRSVERAGWWLEKDGLRQWFA